MRHRIQRATPQLRVGPAAPPTASLVRVAELLGRASLAFDLGNDRTPGATVRAAVIAMELGKRVGASDEALRESYWRILFGSDAIASRFDPLGILRRVEADAGATRAATELEFSAYLRQMVRDIERTHRRDGRAATLELVGHRQNGDAEHHLARTFLDEHQQLFDALEDPRLFERFLALEPGPTELADEVRVEAVARAIAAFSDVTHPIFHSHSTGVAALAERAAAELGLDEKESRTLRVAALLHDVGRLSVPNGIWSHPGPLDWSAWERVRLHPYYTERALGPIAALAEVAEIATTAHERMDGSGYPQRRSARTLSPAARVLAAAHAAFSMSEDRPHRRALTSDAIARELIAETMAGKLEAKAVDAVLASLGMTERVMRRPLHGLSGRELDVARLLTRGKSDKEIGSSLHISPRTVQVHVSRILEKLGVRSRAGAAVWLIEHDLAS